jgi:hypothetical protein
MATNTSLAGQIVAQELQIQRLLTDASIVGGIYTMGFDEALVLTNDLWKAQAGGVSQHCFLLATAMLPGQAPQPEDEEVILLRVIGPAPLPAESELVQVRAEAMREMVVTRGTAAAAASTAILDVLTRNEIQFSALKAKILGTFYDVDVDGTPLLAFGSDVETFYAASRYKVYKPYGQSLAIIASYPQLTEQEERDRQANGVAPRRIRLGTVRYSSTGRLRRSRPDEPQQRPVPILVNVRDFIALKTAVFGMTRLGKSNTMKTIATAICQFGAETRQQIGQLFFDPAGEYANVNVQDRTALSQIGAEFVTIFRFGADGSQPGIRPLSSNFFSDETMDVTWAIITSYLSARNDAIYVRSFLAANVIGPPTEEEDRGGYQRARRRRAALYATLLKANFQVPAQFFFDFSVNANVLTEINQRVANGAPIQGDRRGRVRLNGPDLRRFIDALVEAVRAQANLGDWVDTELQAILDIYTAARGAGFRLLEPLRAYHSIARTDDYADEVLRELMAGKIVIVDLSLGSETILKFCSERIINYILQDAARRFSEGRELNNIQIYIEEAQRLFNRDKMSAPSEADPYVRLAKEAAKYRIGLIYATQDVSSVDPLILSNTSNWVVTHLNNKSEVKELSKYYDFEDFGELTLKAEDVGFARVKTRSSRYIIPSQIDLFDETRVQAARQACLDARNSTPRR